MEIPINIDGNMETATQTVARINASRKAFAENSDSSQGSQRGNSNALMEALTSRLTQQGQGISSSASSSIQASINDAMSDVQRGGESTFNRLQSERGREVGFASDRASAQLTGALESRTGFATQTIALRELTDSTEKSVRDLDQRYQEAIMANDANTASNMAGLRVKKLEFLQTQEENYYRNMITLAGMNQSQSQFEQEQERLGNNAITEAQQFRAKMKQTDDQFTDNLAVQYSQLDLQSQELDIARQRNNISQQEFNLRRSEIEKSKANTALKGMIGQSLVQKIQGGIDISATDPFDDALLYFTQSGGEAGLGMDFDEFSSIYSEARVGALTTPFVPTVDESGGTLMDFFNRNFGQSRGIRVPNRPLTMDDVNRGRSQQQEDNISALTRGDFGGQTISMP